MPLNETHHALLRTASAREDHLVSLPDALKPRVAKALAKALIGSGCAKEVPVTGDQPSWSEAEGKAIGLQLTPAGLAEIGIEDDRSAATSPVSEDKTEQRSADLPRQQLRPNTKLALVVRLLQRPEGASLDDLTGATGWLSHSARAALTGLRKRGYNLERDKGAEGQTRYRLIEEAQASCADPVNG